MTTTTLTAKNAGSVSSVYTILIEGYEWALTNHDSLAAVATALAVTDWTQILGGAFVDIDNEQSIDPFKPLNGGGKCLIRVASTSVSPDRFGIDTHRKRSGFETQLAETITRATGTIKALSTAAFPSSGYIHIGTECISYTGKTTASGITPAAFTGCLRGRFSSFKTGLATPSNFAHEHRVVLDPQSVLLQPVISSTQRTWAGRWVAVYEHRVINGVLDTIEQAHLAFAGRIVDIADDGKSTTVELESVLDVVDTATVGRNLWSGVVKEGVYLRAPMTFELREDSIISGATAQNDADDLVVVSSLLHATGAYQMAEGYYTADELHQRLIAWLAQAHIDGDIRGIYSIYVDPETPDGARTVIEWSISGVTTGNFRLACNVQVATFLGYGLSTGSAATGQTYITTSQQPGGTTQWKISESIPLRSIVDKFGNGDNTRLNFEITDARGSFVDQASSLPASFNIAAPGTPGNPLNYEWGVFLFDNKATIVGVVQRDSAGNVIELIRCQLARVNLGPAYNDDLEAYAVPWDDSSPDITIRQVLVIEAPTAAFINLCFYSTGTAGHNHPTFDGVELGLGLAIPGALLGADFETSVAALPGAGESIVSIIDKATTFKDLLEGDLILRRAFLVWKNGGLRFGSWRTPTADAATITLDDSNKAAPSGAQDDHATHTRESTEWQKPITRIYFDRDITNLSVNEGYRSEVTIEDPTAVDDAGGIGALVTIKVRNAFGVNAGIGANIKALIENYRSTMAMFTRPGKRLTRTLTPSLVEQVALGDIVNVTDNDVRDPATGIRGVTVLPAIVVKKGDSPGGEQLGSAVDDPTATVELFIPHPQARADANYAPAADVDDTYDTGDFDAGYNAVTKTWRCYGYRYGDDGSLVAPLLTDAEYFPSGSKIRITERDPEDPTAPMTWDVTVDTQSGDDVTHLGSAVAGWDPTKRYRITPDTYGDSTTLQRQKSYQADPADGLVEHAGPAYPYSGQAGASVFAENMNATIGIELPADLHGIDGAGRDVGTEQALARALDNFTDYGSALSLPSLGDVMENDEYEAGYLLLEMTPIFLTTEVLTSNVWRELSLAPFMRSMDGSPVWLRATLCRDMPGGYTLRDIDRGAVLAEVTWTTSNTNWETANASEVDCSVKASISGHAWLLVEATYQCQTRGLAQVTESERLFDNDWWVPA